MFKIILYTAFSWNYAMICWNLWFPRNLWLKTTVLRISFKMDGKSLCQKWKCGLKCCEVESVSSSSSSSSSYVNHLKNSFSLKTNPVSKSFVSSDRSKELHHPRDPFSSSGQFHQHLHPTLRQWIYATFLAYIVGRAQTMGIHSSWMQQKSWSQSFP